MKERIHESAAVLPGEMREEPAEAVLFDRKAELAFRVIETLMDFIQVKSMPSGGVRLDLDIEIKRVKNPYNFTTG